MMARQQEIWAQLKQELAEAEFHVLDASDLGDEDTAWLQARFNEQMFPVLTPQAIEPAHPFPFVPNKGFCLVFDLKAKGRGELMREILMLPAALPRFVQIPCDEFRFVSLESVVSCSTKQFFTNFSLFCAAAF